jgi:NAD-dependent SIR2 family protein deacetylase
MKKCSKCGEVKSVSDFNKNKRSKDGLQGYCRACDTEMVKKNIANPNSAYHSLGAGIYAIIRKSDCKTVYVGQAKSLYQRKIDHFHNGKNPGNSYLRRNNLNPAEYEFAIWHRIEDETWRKRLENIYIETLGLPQKLNVF